jgi:hypothetical protein
VRVPDLNWPADLFTDVAGTLLEMTEVASETVPVTPGLWADMLDAWMRKDPAPDVHKRELALESESIA